MVLGYLPSASPPPATPGRQTSAFPAFAAAENNIRPPCAIIFQAEHATLAGLLAGAMLEDVFGTLSPEAIQAAGQHDFGWQASDTRQMEALGHTMPKPFLALGLDETLDSWHACITHAASVTPLVEVLVSRHFTMLGRTDPHRTEFVRVEDERRSRIEKRLAADPADLDRWTAAIGFCDLLSLYLCSGIRDRVEFPLAHPADPRASAAAKITLDWQDDAPRFSRPILKAGSEMKLMVRAYDGHGNRTAPLCLRWRFPGD